MADNIFTHKWIPRVEQREGNVFLEEYYCSTDTKIYMDDEKQTEISFIQYAVQEQLKPLYGYASRTFDDVAVGNRIVTGMFTVPIKNIEEHTSFDDVVTGSANKDSIMDYNDQQLENKDKIDWITGGSGGYEQNNTDYKETVNNEDFAYSEKLSAMGYEYDNTLPPADAFKQQVREFQKDHADDGAGYTDGTLDRNTKDLIDAMLDQANLKVITLLPGTPVYRGPSTAHDIITTLTESTQAYVLSDEYDDWLAVMIPPDIEGYVQEGIAT